MWRGMSEACAPIPTGCPGNWIFPTPLSRARPFPNSISPLVDGSDETALDYRVNGLTNIGIMSRALSINPNIGPTETGLGDTILSVNRVLAFSTQYRALASANLGLTLPTGNDRRGLGDGAFVFEPGLRAGAEWKQVVVQVAGAMAVPAGTSNSSSQANFDVAIGRYFFPTPRVQITPMIEVNTTTGISGSSAGKTNSAILPLLRVKWLRWAVGIGAQVPITDARDFDIRPLFDVIYDY